MEAVQIKMVLANIRFHARIFWRGFCKTVYGALIAGLIAMAIYGFVLAPKEVGRKAVFDYIAAWILLIEALGNMYFMGRKKKNNSGNKERRK